MLDNQFCSDSLLLDFCYHHVKFCSKFHNMKKGHKHSEAAPICDKVVFSKVRTYLSPPVYIYAHPLPVLYSKDASVLLYPVNLPHFLR